MKQQLIVIKKSLQIHGHNNILQKRYSGGCYVENNVFTFPTLIRGFAKALLIISNNAT